MRLLKVRSSSCSTHHWPSKLLIIALIIAFILLTMSPTPSESKISKKLLKLKALKKIGLGWGWLVAKKLFKSKALKGWLNAGWSAPHIKSALIEQFSKGATTINKDPHVIQEIADTFIHLLTLMGRVITPGSSHGWPRTKVSHVTHVSHDGDGGGGGWGSGFTQGFEYFDDHNHHHYSQLIPNDGWLN